MRDYQHILKLAQSLSASNELNHFPTHLIVKMTLGTVGFIATLALTVLIIIKLLNEMRLNQQQSEFLATVSHELKTPIAALELSSSLIRAGELSDSEIDRLWSSHQIELKRLGEEVDTLLQAARWQVRPKLYEKHSLILENWIEQSIEHWRAILGPGATLSREGRPIRAKVLLDLKTLNLIIDNLLNNARKFSQETPRVILRTCQIPRKGLFSKPKWQVQIEDHGWGFDPEDSKKIFHRFFRSRTAAPYAIPGTGLGLYLAQSASRAMGLSLSGRSKGIGDGAVFILEGRQDLIS
jgi:signal transduction histidine kinase